MPALGLIGIANLATGQMGDMALQVKGAIIVAASQILAPEDPGTGNHTFRTNWANRMTDRAALEVQAGKMLLDLALNASVQATGTASDGDVQFVVNSAINKYATS